MQHDASHNAGAHGEHAHCGPGFASPLAAMQGERERVLYTVALRDGTGRETPGYLATVDVDPASQTYSQVI
ncbi:MAG: selenium-binding protein SBP56-related protein, partial [Azonexus sp.]